MGGIRLSLSAISLPMSSNFVRGAHTIRCQTISQLDALLDISAAGSSQTEERALLASPARRC
jgi:hypothetical protein